MARVKNKLAGEIQEAIGRKFANARRNLKLKQWQIAEALKIGRQAVSAWENGVCGIPESKHDALVALGFKIDDLMAGEPQTKYAPAIEHWTDRVAKKEGPTIQKLISASPEEIDLLQAYGRILHVRPDAHREVMKALLDIMAKYRIERRAVDPAGDVDQVKNGNTNGG